MSAGEEGRVSPGGSDRGEEIRGRRVEGGEPERRWHRGEAGGAEETAESEQTLWLLAASPTIWAGHFLACYLTGAIWCAKSVGPAGSLGVVRTAVLLYTVVALGGIAVTGWIGYRRHEHGTAAIPHDFDTPADRHRFLGFATVLLSGLSAVAVLYVAGAALVFETCL